MMNETTKSGRTDAKVMTKNLQAVRLVPAEKPDPARVADLLAWLLRQTRTKREKVA
jgi:hypothetical protein